MSVWIVTADVFADFSDACGTVRASDVRAMLQSSRIAKTDIFLPGQGLSEAERTELEALAAHQGYRDPFRFWRGLGTHQRAPHALTHKHRPENSLISVPEIRADGSYRSALLISAGNEILSDHITGQHLQGMVLIEACRQMFIAVSELCHMDAEAGRRTYVVFNKMSVSFQAFAFPIPAFVDYRELTVTSPRPDRLAVTAELDVVQNDAKTATVQVDYTLFHPERIRRKEIDKGVAAVNAYARAHAPVSAELAAE